jgi:LAO/AO transport system kinase
MDALLQRVTKGDHRALSRALTLAENGNAALVGALAAHGGRSSRRIGITGPPGAGKSTLVSALVKHLRQSGVNKVAVVAVDPSSPFSGGSLLGDRLRMAEHALDHGVYVRSMAARGHYGGLARGCDAACDLLALAGFDPVIIETVGVGQSEVEVAKLAHTVVVVLTPASGDSVQALKAGVMEIADIVVINKSDKPGADRLEEDIREGFDLRGDAHTAGAWRPLIVKTVATTGEGMPALVQAMQQHASHGGRKITLKQA